jgi:hypothetical protein
MSNNKVFTNRATTLGFIMLELQVNANRAREELRQLPPIGTEVKTFSRYTRIEAYSLNLIDGHCYAVTSEGDLLVPEELEVI